MLKILLSILFTLTLSLVGALPMQAVETAIVDNEQASTIVAEATTRNVTVEELQQQLLHQQSRSHMSLLSSLMLVALVVMFFVWNIKRKNQIHLITLERKNIALQREHDIAVEARHATEAALQVKTQFIQQMSHEIRTPLNAISGFTQVLTMEDNGLSPEEMDQIKQLVEENTQYLTTMLNDFIQIADAESAVINNENISTVSLTGLVAGLSEVTNCDVQEGATITTDINMLTIALQKVIDNAVKFGQEASLTMAVDNDILTVTVTDKGQGIDAEDAERIFERFYKKDSFIPGVGLGLNVARSLARSLGGDVGLDTTYKGGGARFVFHIPNYR